ncbi:uncharacterized protein LOC122280888 [Carya illinoinensis]|uniref:uncharacterized protein LOC122280888 n=1 Tax=Carya illinoinensis TaxID=32201 RepID=UPI001C71B999|nr:uncharacterized protein LOC122280888 [Carya illinoinensis]
MQGGGEALNFLAVLTVIRAFAHVYSVIDVLTETLYEILDFCVVVVVLMMLLAVLVWLQRDTFLELSREMSRKIVKNSGNIIRLLDPRAYFSRCHCHTIREETSGFMIQRLKHDVVKRIRDGVYHVNVENIGDVVYNVAPRDNSISRESYNLAAACSNEFVLKSLYYFYPNCNQVCYVMEYYQQSLEHWLQENSLFDHQVKNLNPEFLQILRDVLRGIDYLHSVKKRCHRNLSTLNIVIVNGRAKITGMVNDASTSKTKQDDHLDYKHLAKVIRTCFGSKQQNIPTELKLFLTYISRSKYSKSSRLLNIKNHPIFLSPLQRLCYRVTAYTFLYFGKSRKSFVLTLNNKLQKSKWKDRVDIFQEVLDCREKLKHLSKRQRREFMYNQSAISFMRFARNVIVHLNDNFSRDLVNKKLTVEVVEEELNTCMPEFMPILHEVLVDHGHLMIVHDAVLK